jgi:aerobic carbon-monoxide dehydrogenase medium subunit
MKPAPFEYHAPTELGEAIRLLAALGEGARPLAGGQSLLPMLNLRLARPEALVDLNRIRSLAYHRLEGDTLVIGALCRQRDIERDSGLLDRCAALADAVPLIGHVGIRNRGTVVGSLAHADPSAEWPLLAVLLGATMEVEGTAGRRSIPAEAFFKGLFTTDLRPGELLVEARFPLPPAAAGSAFVEPDGSVAESRLALGGFDSVPVRANSSDPATAAREVKPVDDIHAPAGYRSKLAATLARRALELAESRAREVTGR